VKKKSKLKSSPCWVKKKEHKKKNKIKKEEKKKKKKRKKEKNVFRNETTCDERFLLTM